MKNFLRCSFSDNLRKAKLFVKNKTDDLKMENAK